MRTAIQYLRKWSEKVKIKIQGLMERLERLFDVDVNALEKFSNFSQVAFLALTVALFPICLGAPMWIVYVPIITISISIIGVILWRKWVAKKIL